MIKILAKIFIKNNEKVKDIKVRRMYGMLCSILGIVLNIVLFGTKYFAGIISNSVSIMADAFNNLSDAGSSLITLVGFKFAGAKPDIKHPFGHGRIEYISGFAVSIAIILMGIELAKTSVNKIINPETVETSILTMVILAISVFVKVYMYVYNHSIGKKINSSGMCATAVDSLSDAISTLVVLISAVIMKFTNLKIDGWCGAAVSVFILYSGFNAAKDTLSPLLGQAPKPEFVEKVKDIVLSHKEILGIHDLVVHDYGPGRVMVSLHGEVDGRGNIYDIHNLIDNVEMELSAKLGCEAVIHMDPVDCDNPLLIELKRKILKIISDMNLRLSIHDFRIVPGPEHTNIIFDVVVPPNCEVRDKDIIENITSAIMEENKKYYCKIKIDRQYSEFV